MSIFRSSKGRQANENQQSPTSPRQQQQQQQAQYSSSPPAAPVAIPGSQHQPLQYGRSPPQNAAAGILYGAAADVILGNSPPAQGGGPNRLQKSTRGSKGLGGAFSSSIAPSISGGYGNPSPLSTSPTAAGWYMSTGVQPVNPGLTEADSDASYYTPTGGLSRNTSANLGRKLSTKDKKYDATYRATGLPDPTVGQNSSQSTLAQSRAGQGSVAPVSALSNTRFNPQNIPQRSYAQVESHIRIPETVAPRRDVPPAVYAPIPVSAADVYPVKGEADGVVRNTSGGSRFSRFSTRKANPSPAQVTAPLAQTAEEVPAIQYGDTERPSQIQSVQQQSNPPAQQPLHAVSAVRSAQPLSPRVDQAYQVPQNREQYALPVGAASPIRQNAEFATPSNVQQAPISPSRHRGQRSDAIAHKQEAINQRGGFSPDEIHDYRERERQGVPAFQTWNEDGDREIRNDFAGASPSALDAYSNRQRLEDSHPQSRFTEQMHMVGRQSEDSSVRPPIFATAVHDTQTPRTPSGFLSSHTTSAIPEEEDSAAEYGNLDQRSSAALSPLEIAHQREIAERALTARQHKQRHADEFDAAHDVASGTRQPANTTAMSSADTLTPLDLDSTTNAPSSHHAGPASSLVTAAVVPRTVERSGDVTPQHPSPVQRSRGLPTVATAVSLPSAQVAPEPEPQVLHTRKQRWHGTPEPSSYGPKSVGSLSTAAAPQQAQNGNGSFGNIASDIPHYMYITYQAHVCQECVDSDRRVHATQHGGQEWRFDFADPQQEQPIASDDPNTTKTGRREYTDKVSLAQPADANIGQCQCEECLKKRDMVKYAAENGLIEKIFGGRRHPASETITTTTRTTIVRAPIIEETVTTVKCQEPNCSECAAMTKKHSENEMQNLIENLFQGLLVHQTGNSDIYEDYRNQFGMNEDEDTRTEEEKDLMRRKLNLLLERAGNPRQEKARAEAARSRNESDIVGGAEHVYNQKDDDCELCQQNEHY